MNVPWRGLVGGPRPAAPPPPPSQAPLPLPAQPPAAEQGAPLGQQPDVETGPAEAPGTTPQQLRAPGAPPVSRRQSIGRWDDNSRGWVETNLHCNNPTENNSAGALETGSALQQEQERRIDRHRARRTCVIVRTIWLKLTIFISCLVLITTGLLALVLWSSAHEQLVKEIRLRLTTVAALKQQQLTDYLNSESDKIRLISSRVVITGILSRHQHDYVLSQADYNNGSRDIEVPVVLSLEELKLCVHSILQPNYQSSASVILPEFDLLGAYNLDGIRLFGNNESRSKQANDNVEDVNAVINATQNGGDLGNGVSFHVPYVDANGQLDINMSSPVYQARRLVGVILATINATKLAELIQEPQGLQNSGRVILAFQSPNGSLVYPVRPRGLSNLTSTPFTGPLAQAIKGMSGYLGSYRFPFEGVDSAVAYVPLNYSAWGPTGPIRAGIVASLHVSEAYKPVNDLELVIIIAMIVTFVAGITVSLILARLFTAAIVELSTTAAAIARGHLGARASRGYRLWEDEIDDLRHTFNAMADQIGVAWQTMERKVAQRTQDLNRAIAGLNSEIEERRRIESELEAAKNVAIEADKLKSEWLANMSHEIRTPLNGVINCTELCLDTKVNAEQQEYLELVRPLILQLSSCAACVATSFIGWQEASRSSQSAHDIVLSGNSIKFTSKGEVVVSVSVSSRLDASCIELLFRVQDTGIGIPKEKQSLLFQAFSQVDSSTTRLYGGTGLGLVISSKLATAMDGRMWVDSDEGRGSTFSFTARFMLPPNLTRELSGPFAPSSLAPLKGLRTLVVDASRTIRSTILDLLRRWSMDAEAVPSGSEAAKAIEDAEKREQPFQLLILDLRLPPSPPDNLDCVHLINLLRQRSFLVGPQVDISSLRATSRSLTEEEGRRGAAIAASTPQIGAEGIVVGLRDNLSTAALDDSLEGDFVGGRLEEKMAKITAKSLRSGSSRMQAEVAEFANDGQWLPPAVSVMQPVDEREGSPGPREPGPREARPPLLAEGSDASSIDEFRVAPEREPFLGSTGQSRSAAAALPASTVNLAPDSVTSKPSQAADDKAGGAASKSNTEEGHGEQDSSSSFEKRLEGHYLPGRPLSQNGMDEGTKSQAAGFGHGSTSSRNLRVRSGPDLLVSSSGNGEERPAMAQKPVRRPLLIRAIRTALELTPAQGGATVQMPVYDGLEATKRIRKLEDEQGWHTPIVAMTAHAMAGDGRKCIEAGMDGYISKPLNANKFQDLLRLAAENALPTFSTSMDPL
eukprot:SM000015S01255  [mRNA]  locus=s15:851677:861034:- [translate_table: standard]